MAYASDPKQLKLAIYKLLKLGAEVSPTLVEEAIETRSQHFRRGVPLPMPSTMLEVGMRMRAPGTEMGTTRQAQIPRMFGHPRRRGSPPTHTTVIQRHLARLPLLDAGGTNKKFIGKTFLEIAETEEGRRYLRNLAGRDPNYKGKSKKKGVGRVKGLSARYALEQWERKRYLTRLAKAIADPRIERAGLVPGTKGFHLFDPKNLPQIKKEGLRPMISSIRDPKLGMIASGFRGVGESAQKAISNFALVPEREALTLGSKAEKRFGPFFTLRSAQEGRLPGGTARGMERVGVARVDVSSLAKKGLISPEQIAKLLVPRTPLGERTILGEVQAAGAVAPKLLEKLRTVPRGALSNPGLRALSLLLMLLGGGLTVSQMGGED